MASTIFFCPMRSRAVASLVSIGLPDCGTEPVADCPAVRSPADEATAQPANPARPRTTKMVIGTFHENFRGATAVAAGRFAVVALRPVVLRAVAVSAGDGRTVRACKARSTAAAR